MCGESPTSPGDPTLSDEQRQDAAALLEKRQSSRGLLPRSASPQGQFSALTAADDKASARPDSHVASPPQFLLTRNPRVDRLPLSFSFIRGAIYGEFTAEQLPHMGIGGVLQPILRQARLYDPSKSVSRDRLHSIRPGAISSWVNL